MGVNGVNFPDIPISILNVEYIYPFVTNFADL